MASGNSTSGKAPGFGLQSRDHEEVLDVIDQLRSQGISKYIDLPQLIVCGDQSSGKSSVLNAISGLRFPAKDNVCTRFATELVLRRDNLDDIQVNIQPDIDRPESEKNMLRKFRPSSIDLESFGEMVELAGDTMSMGSTIKTFFKDVLRVEVTGPTQPHLTMVDLPGLFHADTTEQSGADTVDSMVRSYMENTRCIILAVISAKNELALQKVTKLTRKIDPDGGRTLGIITKPDELRRGSDMERLFVTLASNENIKFRLGWHILKNRDYDHRDCTGEERDRLEAEWLSQGVWAALPRHQLGINALRDRLGAVLQDLILSEIPSLTHDLEAAAKDTNASLTRLGDARENASQQRRYLMQSSERFASLLSYAIHGVYDADTFFGDPMTDDGYHKRLRSVFKCTLRAFSDQMAAEGKARRIIDDTEVGEKDRDNSVSRSKYVEEVRILMERTQGRELPGTYNPLIIGDLFYAQAKPWPQIANRYMEELVAYTRLTLSTLLTEVFDPKTAEGLQKQVINPAMDVIEGKLQTKTDEILLPYQQGHPITQNHYFISNIQKSRVQHWKTAISAKLSITVNRNDRTYTKAEVLSAVDALEEVDMERFACLEAIDCMEAYYKVARKTFVDDFAVLAIESCLLRNLSNILSPKIIDRLDDTTIQEIAAETIESRGERARLTEKLENLRLALKTLHRLDRHKPVGSTHPTMRDLHGLLTPPSEEGSRVPSDSLEEACVVPVAKNAGARDEPIGKLERLKFSPFERALEEQPRSDNADNWSFGTPSKKEKKQKRKVEVSD